MAFKSELLDSMRFHNRMGGKGMRGLRMVGGAGPSQLVVIHGFAMSGPLYADAVQRLLPENWGAWLLDLPQHGELASSSGDIGAHLRAVAKELSAAGTANVVVVGESLGCSLVSDLIGELQRAGVGVSGAVLLAPPLTVRPSRLLKWIYKGFSTQGIGALRGGASMIGPLRDLVKDQIIADSIATSPWFMSRVPARYLIHSAVALMRLPLGLRAIRVPSLLLLGERDVLIPAWTLRASAALCGSDQVETWLVPRCGHALLWDPQTPAVAERTRSWLRRVA